jgi:hypothetical protein
LIYGDFASHSDLNNPVANGFDLFFIHEASFTLLQTGWNGHVTPFDTGLGRLSGSQRPCTFASRDQTQLPPGPFQAIFQPGTSVALAARAALLRPKRGKKR